MISVDEKRTRPELEPPAVEPPLPDPRRLARAADVVVAGLVLAAGLSAAVLGLSRPEVAADATATEGRALAALPPLTWSSVFDGSVAGGFEAYLADRVPMRGALLDLDASMRRARGLAPDEDDVVMYSVSPEALELGADPEADLDTEENDPIGASREAADVLTARLDVGARASTRDPGSAVDAGPTVSTATRVLPAGILIRDGRAMQSFGGGPSGAPAYARLLNAIRRSVGERATVYSAIVPTAQEFYLPAGSRGRVRDERPNILGTYARLSPGIRTVDVHGELAAHTDEDLYFRTDHHWTGLGAYYGYRAFCRAAGLTPVPLARMDRRVVAREWRGSLFRLTRDPDLREEQIEIAVPPAQAEVHVTSWRGRVVPLFRDEARGYGVFLGGDYPILRARTSTHNGRRAILVKNSFGNAFAVYLVSHYEELVFVDYRSFQGSLSRLLGESAMPTDLIFMNGTQTANSRAHTALIRRLLESRG